MITDAQMAEFKAPFKQYQGGLLKIKYLDTDTVRLGEVTLIDLRNEGEDQELVVTFKWFRELKENPVNWEDLPTTQHILPLSKTTFVLGREGLGYQVEGNWEQGVFSVKGVRTIPDVSLITGK